jgi:hypothetical protein
VEIGMAKAQRKPRKQAVDDKIEIEPGADKRLANILKQALNTPRSAASSKTERNGTKAAKSDKS